MPNFYVWPMGQANEDSFWIYALDDFDARDQIASTLSVDAHCEKTFGCEQDDRFKVPLNMILHSTGEWTQVPDPRGCCDRAGNEGCAGSET
ncbi:hypothetical protein [Beijerinckia sp. L45]|uniref:hypothetical protein n=1 Tax=Beijerinckia sp. L45 TaxID=1641855 RepID=UPI00131EA99D|nr:hypothetical protein [Beijerinckia sp. L45]